jgi:hypothetical protein
LRVIGDDELWALQNEDANPNLVVIDLKIGRAKKPGLAPSASDTLGLLGTLNVDNGVVTPIVTGFGSARGLLFVAPDLDKDGGDK